LTLTPSILHNPHPFEEVIKSPQHLTIPLIAALVFFVFSSD
jgi:hypothetical protein